MPVRGSYLAIAGAGAIFLWSGLKNKSWSGVLRNVITGQNPATAGTAENISAGPVITASTNTAAGSGGGPAVNVSPGASQSQWISQLLHGLGAPATQANIRSIASWMAHEEPSSDWNHWNNPLNTTLDYGGGVSANGVGVKNYPSLEVGLQATIRTLLGSNYDAIVGALQSGNGLCGQSFAALSTWSGGGYSRVC